MNQSKTRLLRYLFRQIQPFAAGDSRNRTAWRNFKNIYNKVPRPGRSGYIDALKEQIAKAFPQENALQNGI